MDDSKQKILILASDVDRYANDILNEIYKYDKSANIVVGTPNPKNSNHKYLLNKDGQTITDRSHPYNSQRLYSPVSVFINNKALRDSIEYDGNNVKYVDANEAIRFLWTCYHEIAHVRLRTREFVRIDTSDLIKKIAVNSLCADFLPEYYDQGYYKSPEEIFCERYAFDRMSKFCESHSLSFEWKSMLKNRVADSHFLNLPSDVKYNDIENIYNDLLDNVFAKPRINGHVRPVEGKHDFSLQFKYLRDFHNFDFCSILYEHDGMRQANFLARYIAQHDASRFRQFQCIKADFEQYFNPVNRESERIVGDKLLGVKGYKAEDFDRSELFRKADKIDDVNIEDFDDIRNARVAEVDMFDIEDDSDISRTDPTDDW